MQKHLGSRGSNTDDDGGLYEYGGGAVLGNSSVAGLMIGLNRPGVRARLLRYILNDNLGDRREDRLNALDAIFRRLAYAFIAGSFWFWLVIVAMSGKF